MKKKVIPVIAAIVLIIIVILFILLGKLIEKYTPSKEHEELSEYYQMSQPDDVALILNNEVLTAQGRMIDGYVYLDFNTVHDLINDRFYWDTNENKLLYTTATDLISADAESTTYYVTKNAVNSDHIIVKVDAATAYIALDFVKQYSDISYTVYESPNRVVLTNAWGDYTVASTKKDTELRYQGGIKSPILADIAKGTALTVLEPDETWTKVASADGVIGYVKSKTLGSTSTETLVSDYIPESFSHIKKDFRISMGWHQVTNSTANSNVANVISSTKGMNVISPTWFYLKDTNGGIGSLASSDYVNYCHQNGIEVWALVSNFGARDQGLGNPSTVGDPYIQFIRELSLKCANNGIVLSVDNYSPTAYTAFYNRSEQAVFADYVILMGYDEHYVGSEEAGSVASIGFVRQGVADTLQEVPADQLILGMPFYTRVWSETPVSEDGAAISDAEGTSDSYTLFELDCYSASMKETQNLISANGAVPVWSDDCAQYYVEYVNGGVTYKIWVEDSASLEEKLKVLQENQLAGGAFWKLTLEDPTVWDTIIKYIN